MAKQQNDGRAVKCPPDEPVFGVQSTVLQYGASLYRLIGQRMRYKTLRRRLEVVLVQGLFVCLSLLLSLCIGAQSSSYIDKSLHDIDGLSKSLVFPLVPHEAIVHRNRHLREVDDGNADIYVDRLYQGPGTHCKFLKYHIKLRTL